LTSRNQHLLALRVSSHLGLAPDAVLKHWARTKIARSRTVDSAGADEDDAALCELIVRQFERAGRGGVSYAEIARRAWELGRSGLATRLLEHERSGGEQVPLLLSMQEDRLALLKAVDSGDTDLGTLHICYFYFDTVVDFEAVYHVLLHLHKRLSLGTFFRLIEEGGARLAPASRLLEVYARAQNREMLRDFYYSDDRRVESAILCLDEAAQMQVCVNLLSTFTCH
jgi:vacuolar protein sorting-associated protein 16